MCSVSMRTPLCLGAYACVCLCVCVHHYTTIKVFRVSVNLKGVYTVHIIFFTCVFTVDNNQCIMVVPTESIVHHTAMCNCGIHCGLHYRLLFSSARTTCTFEGLEKVVSS